MATQQADRSEIRRALASLSLRDWVFLGSTVVGVFSLVLSIVFFLLVQVGRIDRLEELMTDTRATLHRIESTMAIKDEINNQFDGLRVEFKKTHDLLVADLTWRYLYQNQPSWKNYEPRYDPISQTLQFVPGAPEGKRQK